MRTKALLLAAAFAAAGVSTSVAQAVYSVNAVGYVNVTVVNGYNMIANPLNAGTGNNTITKLFAPANFSPSIPGGSDVYIFETSGPKIGQYTKATYSSLTSAWGGEGATREILPGDGVFFRNPSANAVTITFVGEVMQGNLSNPLPQGFSIKSSQVPQAVKPDAAGIGFPGTGGDQVFRFNPNGTTDPKGPNTYTTYTYSTLTSAWNPALPTFNVGESFFVRRLNSAGTWNRTFSVNG
jgi:hypothetical protein